MSAQSVTVCYWVVFTQVGMMYIGVKANTTYLRHNLRHKVKLNIQSFVIDIKFFYTFIITGHCLSDL